MVDITGAEHETRWTSMDKAAIEIVRGWMAEGPVRHSMKDCAQVLGCSYPRIRAQFRYTYSPLTLGDFSKLCDYFGRDPVEAWLDVRSKACEMDGEIDKADAVKRKAGMIKALTVAISTTGAFQGK